MFNWKKKIDDQEEAQRQAQVRAETEAKARQLAGQKEQEERSRKELQAKYRDLAQKFQCHVCRKSAKTPLETHNSDIPGGWQGEHGDYHGTSWTEKDWSKPGDLWQCSKCNKWTCEEHIYKGICQICAEKM